MVGGGGGLAFRRGPFIGGILLKLRSSCVRSFLRNINSLTVGIYFTHKRTNESMQALFLPFLSRFWIGTLRGRGAGGNATLLKIRSHCVKEGKKESKKERK